MINEKIEIEKSEIPKVLYVKIDVFGFYGIEYSIFINEKPVACRRMFTGEVQENYYMDEYSELKINSDEFNIIAVITSKTYIFYEDDRGGSVKISVQDSNIKL
ncbi:MAG: hypothetical protein QXV17_14870 [Candidatus Micrarchaeaceae archaeon]